jgi:tRNA-dihydrouridine synthase
MMSSVQFAADPEYRASAFQTVPEDRPLVAHFSANDPAVMLAAAKLIEHQVYLRNRCNEHRWERLRPSQLKEN